MVCPLSVIPIALFDWGGGGGGGIKVGGLVLSIVERYLIQCPFLSVR